MGTPWQPVLWARKVLELATFDRVVNLISNPHKLWPEMVSKDMALIWDESPEEVCCSTTPSTGLLDHIHTYSIGFCVKNMLDKHSFEDLHDCVQIWLKRFLWKDICCLTNWSFRSLLRLAQVWLNSSYQAFKFVPWSEYSSAGVTQWAINLLSTRRNESMFIRSSRCTLRVVRHLKTLPHLFKLCMPMRMRNTLKQFIPVEYFSSLSTRKYMHVNSWDIAVLCLKNVVCTVIMICLYSLQAVS